MAEKLYTTVYYYCPVENKKALLVIDKELKPSYKGQSFLCAEELIDGSWDIIQIDNENDIDTKSQATIIAYSLKKLSNCLLIDFPVAEQKVKGVILECDIVHSDRAQNGFEFFPKERKDYVVVKKWIYSI